MSVDSSETPTGEAHDAPKVRGPAPPALSHLDERGEARMVDVGEKAVSRRVAIARAEVRLSAATFAALADGAPKGDVIAVARLAGIQAAKRTWELIPLCHPIRIDGIRLDVDPRPGEGVVRIEAEVRCDERTGVEMEAMTAVSVAALALYDMLKGIERGIVLGPIRLVEKRGGRSGVWRAAE